MSHFRKSLALQLTTKIKQTDTKT